MRPVGRQRPQIGAYGWHSTMSGDGFAKMREKHRRRICKDGVRNRGRWICTAGGVQYRGLRGRWMCKVRGGRGLRLRDVSAFGFSELRGGARLTRARVGTDDDFFRYSLVEHDLRDAVGSARKQMKSQSPLRKTGFPGRFAKLGSALPALLCFFCDRLRRALPSCASHMWGRFATLQPPGMNSDGQRPAGLPEPIYVPSSITWMTDRGIRRR